MGHYAMLLIYEGEMVDVDSTVGGMLKRYNFNENRTAREIAWTKESIDRFRPEITGRLLRMSEEEADNHSLHLYRRLYPRRDEVAGMPHEEYVKLGYDLEVDDEGNAMAYVNPEGKFDWYEIGGRFKECLVLKKDPSKGVDVAYAGDVDWEASARPFDNGIFSTPIVCSKDGWFDEKSDKDGWKAGYSERFLKDLRDDTVLVVVDIHI